MAVNESLTTLFGPVLQLPPIVSIFVISFILGLASTLAYKYLTDQAVMKETKGTMKKLQNEIKNEKDVTKISALQKRIMKLNFKYMSFSMKPMLVTLIPFLLVFSWLRHTFAEQAIINFPFSLPLFGSSLGWLGTYLIFSLMLTTLLRKLMKVV